LGLALRDFRQRNPDSRGVVLGGHGVMSWGATSDECEATSLELIETAERFLADHGRVEPFGRPVAERHRLGHDQRRAEAVRLAPIVRGIGSFDRPTIAHFTDAPVVLDFLEHEAADRLVALGTSCPDHFLRTKVRPLLLDMSPNASLGDRVERLRVLHVEYRDEYASYYSRHANEDSPPLRGGDPAIVLIPGVGMWSFGSDPATARITGEFYVNAINVMRYAESVSSYEPIPESEKFRIEYWDLEERKLRMKPPPPPLAGRVALITGAASGIGLAIAERLAQEGACVVIADLDGDAAEKAAASIGSERTLTVTTDVSSERGVDSAFAAAALRFGGVDLVVNNAGFARSAELVDTSVDDWDSLHAVLARGSFLVSRAAARMMIAAGTPGDLVYIVSKNAVVAGPSNVAYGAAKADQAHQVRLLAAELGAHGIRVNGINPDGVVEGSGIFNSEWRSERAVAYGVEPDQLGAYYAGRTLLGEEVRPTHVADAVIALTTGQLSRTTGLVVPVDGGVAAAFLR
jgi:rhamnulose-1-phosphate aldolase/alcohol dehydrogenase